MGGRRSLGARALLTLISVGPMSRGNLVECLGLSMATTTHTAHPLIEMGFIKEQPPVEVVGPGRPVRLLVVTPGSATVAGIKLTDDHLYAVLADPLGEVLISDSRPLTDIDVGSVTALIALMVAQLAERNGRRPDTTGVSLGAAVVGRRAVVVISFLGWRDAPLAVMVSEATGLPCVAANDVRTFTYAEAWFGVGHGKDPFTMITLGAGIGCGVVVAGEIVSSAQGTIDNVGHLPVDPSGPSCKIGHPECVRVLVSTPGILQVVIEHPEYEAGELSLGLLLSPDMHHHNGVNDVLRHAVLAVGRVVGILTTYVDLELVVVSGEGVVAVETYREVFDKEVGGLRYWAAAPVSVLLRPFEFDEWARGAAALVLDRWMAVVDGRRRRLLTGYDTVTGTISRKQVLA